MALQNNSLADYLYDRLPKVYQTEDREQLLRRFIETFSEGGFDPLLQETISITDLLDVDKCPSRFLPKLCAMYGYEYTLEIPELFQRRLLKHIVEMYKRKGTKSVVRFIARELTGFDSEIIENKDFTADHVELTGWDIKFEHYRNFILKLTAPYEDSNLFNKEDIVVKIINDFLPTNSQVLVITAYWFKEESEIVKQSVESIYDVVNDYNLEIFYNRIAEGEETSVVQDCTYSYDYAIFGEEDSYLNYPLEGMTLTTNAILKIRDTIRFNIESYVFRHKTGEDETLYSNCINEGDYSKVVGLVSEERNRITDEVHTDIFQNAIEVLELINVALAVEEESHTVNPFSITIDLTKIKDTLEDLLYSKGRINYTDCDIMGLNDETATLKYSEVVNHENLFLNKSMNLHTNALMMWDIVKEKGKPDQIIIL